MAGSMVLYRIRRGDCPLKTTPNLNLPNSPQVKATEDSLQEDVRQLGQTVTHLIEAVRTMGDNLYEDLVRGRARHKIYGNLLSAGNVDEGEIQLCDPGSAPRRLYARMNDTARFINFSTGSGGGGILMTQGYYCVAGASNRELKSSLIGFEPKTFLILPHSGLGGNCEEPLWKTDIMAKSAGYIFFFARIETSIGVLFSGSKVYTSNNYTRSNHTYWWTAWGGF